jgi:hypothetical protein
MLQIKATLYLKQCLTRRSNIIPQACAVVGVVKEQSNSGCCLHLHVLVAAAPLTSKGGSAWEVFNKWHLACSAAAAVQGEDDENFDEDDLDRLAEAADEVRPQHKRFRAEMH